MAVTSTGPAAHPTKVNPIIISAARFQHDRHPRLFRLNWNGLLQKIISMSYEEPESWLIRSRLLNRSHQTKPNSVTLGSLCTIGPATRVLSPRTQEDEHAHHHRTFPHQDDGTPQNHDP
jgi:hypothetical protein